ncbi:hypothetical protein K505DRAFT_320843 [Melanomma pulvis-pyrius CBS 109.77]|uniref:Uncharacterized protein n=1 Tax=Melanomma pulvis-pyrius CBS 109.77 TaxID=1314802 RepID=A0A6A6XUG4_9PLEO|nr:hypothetical protein K505DRAFT_320843 [Melanomma pulvis-pyrius CBS 109.77]
MSRVNYTPFETPPATAQWGRTVTHDDYTKMLQGFQPQSMDDKWTIKADTPEDAQGNTVVHAYFGRQNYEEIALTIATGDPNKIECLDWATITKISWKVEHPGGTELTEKEAKERAISLCKGLLRCAMEEEEEEEEEEKEEEED